MRYSLEVVIGMAYSHSYPFIYKGLKNTQLEQFSEERVFLWTFMPPVFTVINTICSLLILHYCPPHHTEPGSSQGPGTEGAEGQPCCFIQREGETGRGAGFHFSSLKTCANLKMPTECLFFPPRPGSGLGLTYLSNWGSRASKASFSIQLLWTTERDAQQPKKIIQKTESTAEWGS